MSQRTLLDAKEIELTIRRLCYQLIENHDNFSNSVLIGLQPRGCQLAERILAQVQAITGVSSIQYGKLDSTFFRDDFRRKGVPLTANRTQIDFLVEGKKVILVDDVLYTGRSIRAAMDALLAFGRPEAVELLTLIDRRFARHLPIQPDYIGKTVDSVASERVTVNWVESDGIDQVLLHKQGE